MNAIPPQVAAANRRMLRKLLVATAVMFGFAFALVPFYDKICEATGLRSALRPDEAGAVNSQVVASRNVRVELDANTRRLAWKFRPLEASVSVHPGELRQVEYEITNAADHPVTGRAIPSFSPSQAALYFKKIECFCFRQQTLAPGESRRLPVVFVVDPALPQDIGTVTLSYTFFEVNGT